MTDRIGSEIGAYQIIERLGRGGMADVYKALHRDLNVHRAIKFIRPEFSGSEDFRARFQKEAQAVAQLRHANIVQIHDFGEHEGSYYMVMEFVHGANLKQALSDGVSFPAREAIELVADVAQALTYAHGRDLIHRDIKPDNIMLNEDGQPILMDFGIAKLLSADTQLTQTGVGVGTPSYMAPEQAQGMKVTPSADIYALSIVLFELLTGRAPFQADTPLAVMLKAISDPIPMPRSFNPDISEELQNIVLKGTAKDPEHRYQSAREFRQALLNYLDGAPASTQPPPQPAPAAEVPATVPPPTVIAEVVKERSKTLPLAVLGVAVVAALVLWLLMGDDSLESPNPPAVGTPGAGDTVDRVPAAETSESVVFAYRGEVEGEGVIEKNIDLEAGSVLYLMVHDTDVTTDFTLMRPDERGSEFSATRKLGPHTVERAGSYRFFIDTRGDKPGNVDVELLRLPEPVIDGGAIDFGAYVLGETTLPGQVIEYQVPLEQGDVLYLDTERSETTTDFVLAGERGRNEVFNNWRDTGPHEVKRAGTYTLRADPRNDYLADYEFRLVKLSPPVIDKGKLALNEESSISTTDPGQYAQYELELDKAGWVYLEVFDSAEITDFVLRQGRNELFNNWRTSGPFEVPAGKMQLTVDPRNDRLANAEFLIHDVSPKVIQSEQGLVLGEAISGATQVPGQGFAFPPVELKSGDSVSLEIIQSSDVTDYRLTSDKGVVVFDQWRGNVTQEIPADGSYVLSADPRNAAVVEFQLQLTKL